MRWLPCLARDASSLLVRCSFRRSSNCTVALLVFLSRSAGTWIVAAHFRLVAHNGLPFASFFSGSGRALVWPGKVHRCASRGAPALQFGWFSFRDDLQIEERPDRGGIDAIQHRLKQIETFFLVFDQRIFLSVTDQADSLLQMIERQQVVLPLRIDDVEHDDALVSAHRFFADLFLLLGILPL